MPFEFVYYSDLCVVFDFCAVTWLIILHVLKICRNLALGQNKGPPMATKINPVQKTTLVSFHKLDSFIHLFATFHASHAWRLALISLLFACENLQLLYRQILSPPAEPQSSGTIPAYLCSGPIFLLLHGWFLFRPFHHWRRHNLRSRCIPSLRRSWTTITTIPTITTNSSRTLFLGDCCETEPRR